MRGHEAPDGEHGRAGRALDLARRREGPGVRKARGDAARLRADLEVLHASRALPRGRAEFPHEVVDHVARQVNVLADQFAAYEWSGSTFDYHKKQVRDHLGFKECSVAIADKLTEWLAVNMGGSTGNVVNQSVASSPWDCDRFDVPDESAQPKRRPAAVKQPSRTSRPAQRDASRSPHKPWATRPNAPTTTPP